MDSPEPVTRGNPLTLTASAMTGQASSSVSFYRESNGINGLQAGFGGDTLVGTDTDGTNGWSAVAPTLSVSPGTYTYWAQATDTLGLAGAPASTLNTIVAPAGPLVIDSNFVYQTAQNKITLTFDRDVHTSISADNFFVQRLPGGAVPTFTMLPYGTDGTNVVSFVFSTRPVDGNYRATLDGSTVLDPNTATSMTANYVFDFFQLTADANHDRVVDIKDLYILAVNYNASGKNYNQADFNYDGKVDAMDLGILSGRMKQRLQPPLASPASLTRPPARGAVRAIDLVPLE